MRVLILGAGGMLGHQLCLDYRHRFDTWATVRSTPAAYAQYDLLPADRLLGGVDATNFDTVLRAFGTARPAVVINCIGIIKQLPVAKDPLVSLSLNALFPHRLAQLCKASGTRLIHISTDCVFSGRKGMYTEDDEADALDLYGKSKFLGEVSGENNLTLRTSIIGRELASSHGLVEWFLSNQGQTVRGFTQAIYSGFTTQAIAGIIAAVINDHPQLSGLYHVSSAPISKFDLLVRLREALRLDIEIEPYDGVVIDRSLDSRRFQATTALVPPEWPEMIAALVDDTTPYEQWRK